MGIAARFSFFSASYLPERKFVVKNLMINVKNILTNINPAVILTVQSRKHRNLCRSVTNSFEVRCEFEIRVASSRKRSRMEISMKNNIDVKNVSQNGQNNKLEKIRKSSHVALLITRIGKIFTIAMAFVAFLCGIACIAADALGGEKLYVQIQEKAPDTEFMMGIDMQLFGFSVKASDMLNTGDAEWLDVVGIYLIVFCVVISLIAVLLHFVEKTFREIRDSDSPFRPVILKNLSLPFILITLFAAMNSLYFGAVVGIAFWCVYCILDYGCELQRLSDETL